MQVVAYLEKAVPCIKWVYTGFNDTPRPNVVVKKGFNPPCSSYVGYQSTLRSQTIYVTDECLADNATLLHLFMHTLGLAHSSYANVTQTFTVADLRLLRVEYCDHTSDDDHKFGRFVSPTVAPQTSRPVPSFFWPTPTPDPNSRVHLDRFVLGVTTQQPFKKELWRQEQRAQQAGSTQGPPGPPGAVTSPPTPASTTPAASNGPSAPAPIDVPSELRPFAVFESG